VFSSFKAFSNSKHIFIEGLEKQGHEIIFIEMECFSFHSLFLETYQIPLGTYFFIYLTIQKIIL